MQELIKITNKDGRQVVSASELHSFLGISTPLSIWAPRMFEYGFIDGHDFTTILLESTGGRPAKDYALTLDCAKHICMVQRSEKGMHARNYFIEMEKRARHAPAIAVTRKELAQMLLDAENEIEQLQLKTSTQEKELKTAAPKVVYHDKVLQSGSLIPITVIAKELGMSGEALNKKLQALGIQYQVGGVWVLYAKYHGQGWTGLKTATFTDSEGRSKTVQRTYWTEKGRRYIHQLLNPGVAQMSMPEPTGPIDLQPGEGVMIDGKLIGREKDWKNGGTVGDY